MFPPPLAKPRKPAFHDFPAEKVTDRRDDISRGAARALGMKTNEIAHLQGEKRLSLPLVVNTTP